MLSDFSYLDLLAVVRVHLAIHRLIKYLPLWLGHRIVDSSAERYVQIDARITASLPQLSGLGALSIALQALRGFALVDVGQTRMLKNKKQATTSCTANPTMTITVGTHVHRRHTRRYEEVTI